MQLSVVGGILASSLWSPNAEKGMKFISSNRWRLLPPPLTNLGVELSFVESLAI